ncbi:M16 family metallopeptidase [Thiolapillus brandeum]|uniref:Peptidase M16 family protein n=1 Tax=Thiolapillus brandeum TaxID=1076588 RepID=A0A7U6GJR4_9GAMM|nr:pitrilysin family protein [Thiolapillus brandeum]BAO44956.1 peptidase M16 family protein [Thiolapillus brandeum]
MIRIWSLLMLVLIMGQSQALEVQSWQTQGGTRVMYVHAPQLPMVNLQVMFDAGSARDGDLPGQARMLNELLPEGAGKWNADELARELESRGIEISTHTGRDMASITLRSLSDKNILTPALDMLAAMVSAPGLDAAAIERVKARTLADLRLASQSAEQVADREMMQILYGDHPYAHDPLGTEAALARIDQAALRAFHQRYYTQANAVVALVGDVDRTQAETLVAHVLAGLSVGQRAAPLADPKPGKAGRQHRNFPASQTHLYLGMLGISRKDPDYFPLIVGNHILGGSGLTSIMGEEVRNKRGLSYGISSYFAPLRVKGPWMLTAQTRNSQARKTLELMTALLRDFIDEGPTQKQLEAAKKHLAGGFPLKLSSNKKILSQISTMAFYDLPPDWLDIWPTRVQQVTRAQIHRSFHRRMPMKHLQQLTVGGGK